MSPTQTIAPTKSRESIELSSLPLQTNTSNSTTGMNTLNRINEDNHINTHRNHTNAERAITTGTDLGKFPDPLGLRARIFTPSADDDKGS